CRARCSTRRCAGFTLIELMTAVFIMGLLLAVGAPSFTAFIQNVQIRSVAESLQSGLNLARDEAVKRNGNVSLWLVDGLTAGCARSASVAAWVVSLDDPTGNCNAAPSTGTVPRLLQSRTLGEGSSNVLVDATGGTCATFNSFGRLQNSCASASAGAPVQRIDFRSRVAPAATRALALTILAGGAVKLCHDGAAASDANYCQPKGP
ncbi:MAG: GspH/FimT family pseudopilin, partial [Janthinobacterium lividum]